MEGCGSLSVSLGVVLLLLFVVVVVVVVVKEMGETRMASEPWRWKEALRYEGGF